MRKAIGPCLVEDCGKQPHARGYCHFHYERWQKHGDPLAGGRSPEKHGMSHTSEYHAWNNMIRRCYDPKFKQFKDYGGRGIRVSDEFRSSFVTFYKHVGLKPTPQHTLDRIDNNGNYERGNLRWATHWQQVTNQRRNHHKYTV